METVGDGHKGAAATATGAQVIGAPCEEANGGGKDEASNEIDVEASPLWADGNAIGNVTSGSRGLWSFALNAAMVGIGIALAMLGPTLLELADQLQVSLSKASTLFTFRALGYLVGAMSCGQLLERVRPSAVMLAPLLCACAGCAVIPTLQVHTWGCFLFSFQGMSMGMLDVGGNVLLLSIWRGSEYINGLMHGLHFSFGLGAFIAPLFVGIWIDLGRPPVDAWNLVAIGLVPCCLCFSCLTCTKQPQIDPEPKGEGALNRVVLGTGAFLFVYVGLEVAYGGFIDAFAVEHWKAGSDNAAWLTSIYWGSLCAGRLVAAVVTPLVNHQKYLGVHLIAAILAAAWLGIASSHPAAAFPGWFAGAVVPSAVVGFAFAPLFPGAMLIAEELLGRALSGPAASIIVTLSAAGEMVLPLIVGSLMSIEPMLFCWSQLLLCSAAAILFMVLLRGREADLPCCMCQPLLDKAGNKPDMALPEET